MMSEYRADKYTTVRRIIPRDRLLSVTSVIFGGPAIRTYYTATECEILYLPYQSLADTLKRYPDEATYFTTCIKEFGPKYDVLVQEYAAVNLEYQAIQREKLAKSIAEAQKKQKFKQKFVQKFKKFLQFFVRFYKEYRTNPESRFIVLWMYIRAVAALISITMVSLRVPGIIMATISTKSPILLLTDTMGWIDMFIKLQLPYFKANGIVVSSFYKCILRYLLGSFILDLIGNTDLVVTLYEYFTEDIISRSLVATTCKFTQVYIVLSVFRYLENSPHQRLAHLTLAKWQILSFLMLLYASDFYFARCITFKSANHAVQTDTCWVPNYLQISKNPTVFERTLLFTQCMSLVQYMSLKIPSSIWDIHENSIVFVVFSMFSLGFTLWYFYCVCQSFIILSLRSTSSFYYDVRRLNGFLLAERVPKDVVAKTLDYFNYFWKRSKGLTVGLNESVGVVFREDLCYYFNKRTLEIVSNLLNGGDMLQRQISRTVTELNLLPGQDIMREMDLTGKVFILNRGKAELTKEGKRLTVLTKGAIFGQLQGRTVRPSRATVTAMIETDVMVMSIKSFQQIIEQNKAAKQKLQATPIKEDYLNTPRPIEEEPKNTIEYLVREDNKVMQIPGLKKVFHTDRHKWFSLWLLVHWFPLPVLTTALTGLIGVFTHIDEEKRDRWHVHAPLSILLTLSILDFLFLLYIISEIIEVRLVAKEKSLGFEYLWKTKFMNPFFYIDSLSLIIPIMALGTDMWVFHFVRLLRIHTVLDVERHFCRSMKNAYLPLVVKCSLFFLLIHSLACGWVTLSCRGAHYIQIPVPSSLIVNYDPTNYIVDGHVRHGCSRTTQQFVDDANETMRAFVFVKSREADYLLAFHFVICTLTWTNTDMIVPATLLATVYKVIVVSILLIMDLYVGSMAVGNIYAQARNKHRYDAKIKDFLLYLKNNGLSSILFSAVIKIVGKSFDTQIVCQMPDIINDAPLCLIEDVMESLYIHHLRGPLLFQTLPKFFLRQLVTRLKRIIIFPDKCIVEEGDIYPCIFFIHEGEVEKWHTDPNTGDSNMSAVLTTNGYFGIIPGLFPNTPYQFSYYSRTVVDLVYLKFEHWQDLLSGHPAVKYQLYVAALAIKQAN